MIRVPQLRIVDEEGSQLGVMPTGEALRLAQERGYDLVEVAPMAAPPVARLLDYGQFKYEQARREKEARRHQRSVEFKEIRLKPKIAKGDFDTRVRRAIEFLEDGDRIKVTVQFRGREVSHAYIGRDLLTRFGDLIREHGTVERQPILEGKSMSMVVTSTHKPRPIPAREHEAAAAERQAPRSGAATSPPRVEETQPAAARPPQNGTNGPAAAAETSPIEAPQGAAGVPAGSPRAQEAPVREPAGG